MLLLRLTGRHSRAIKTRRFEKVKEGHTTESGVRIERRLEGNTFLAKERTTRGLKRTLNLALTRITILRQLARVNVRRRRLNTNLYRRGNRVDARHELANAKLNAKGSRRAILNIDRNGRRINTGRLMNFNRSRNDTANKTPNLFDRMCNIIDRVACLPFYLFKY